MGEVIRSPRVSTPPRLLRTPGLPSEVRAGQEDPHTKTHATEPAPEPAEDPVMKARITDAEMAAERAVDELAALRAELDSLREEARLEGYEAGRVEGAEQAQADLAQRIEQVAGLCEQLGRRVREELAIAEDSIAEAVMAAVCKLLGEAMTTREGVLAAVRAVCEQMGQREQLVLRLNPADHELLHEHDGLARSAGAGARFEADSSVDLGGCVVASTSGGLDGRLERQLDALRSVLLETRSARGEGS